MKFIGFRSALKRKARALGVLSMGVTIAYERHLDR